jgi:hypothetical protein
VTAAANGQHRPYRLSFSNAHTDNFDLLAAFEAVLRQRRTSGDLSGNTPTSYQPGL